MMRRRRRGTRRPTRNRGLHGTPSDHASLVVDALAHFEQDLKVTESLLARSCTGAAVSLKETNQQQGRLTAHVEETSDRLIGDLRRRIDKANVKLTDLNEAFIGACVIKRK